MHWQSPRPGPPACTVTSEPGNFRLHPSVNGTAPSATDAQCSLLTWFYPAGKEMTFSSTFLLHVFVFGCTCGLYHSKKCLSTTCLNVWPCTHALLGYTLGYIHYFTYSSHTRWCAQLWLPISPGTRIRQLLIQTLCPGITVSLVGHWVVLEHSWHRNHLHWQLPTSGLKHWHLLTHFPTLLLPLYPC